MLDVIAEPIVYVVHAADTSYMESVGKMDLAQLVNPGLHPHRHHP